MQFPSYQRYTRWRTRGQQEIPSLGEYKQGYIIHHMSDTRRVQLEHAA
jgi:hypothetical protein